MKIGDKVWVWLECEQTLRIEEMEILEMEPTDDGMDTRLKLKRVGPGDPLFRRLCASYVASTRRGCLVDALNAYHELITHYQHQSDLARAAIQEGEALLAQIDGEAP